jgi:hypothetical protein
MMAVEEAGEKPELGWIVFDEAKAMAVELMAHGAEVWWWWCVRCSWVDLGVELAIDVSTPKVAEADETAEQGAISVTVAVTVMTQEAGQVRGHAVTNGENEMTASANVRMDGDITGWSRWVMYIMWLDSNGYQIEGTNERKKTSECRERVWWWKKSGWLMLWFEE